MSKDRWRIYIAEPFKEWVTRCAGVGGIARTVLGGRFSVTVWEEVFAKFAYDVR